MALVLQDEYFPDTGNESGTGTTEGNKLAQTFTPTSAYDLEAIAIRTTTQVVPTTVAGGIYAVDGNHKPTGGALATFTFNLTIPTGSPGWVIANLDSAIELTAGIEYAIVLEGHSGDDTWWWWKNGPEPTEYVGYVPWLWTVAEGWQGYFTYRDFFFRLYSLGYEYIVNDTQTGSDGETYICIDDHTESSDTIPITGADWEDYWLLGDELMVRMIPFIYSSSIAYECEFGGSYIRFFYNGEALMDNGSHVEVAAPYLQADLFELNIEQVGDVMWITHPNYAQRKLSRVSATEFSLDVIKFNKGPFLLRNDLIDPDVQDTAKMSISGLTIATATAGAAGVGTFTIESATDISSLFPPNRPFAVYGSTGNDANYTVHETTPTDYTGTTVTIYVNEVIDDGADNGKILVVGATDTLVSTGAIFDNPGHEGALFKLVHPRILKEISLKGAGTTKAIEVKGTARYVSTGRWSGTWHVQRNQNSSGWEKYRTYKGLTAGARNDSLAFTEKDDNVFYRIYAEAGISADFGATLTVNKSTQEGIVKVTGFINANSVFVEIIKLPASTAATRRWAEGTWSPLRGYPASVTFHGNRCVYAGESPIVSQIIPD